MRWSGLANAILVGAKENKTLKHLRLLTRPDTIPSPDLVESVRKANPKLRLMIKAGGKQYQSCMHILHNYIRLITLNL